MLTQMKARSFIVLLNQFFSLLGIMIISKSLDIQSFYIFSSAIILFQVLFVITEWGFAFYSINFFKKNSDNKIKNYLVILIFASKFILLLCIIFVISIFSVTII
jgi:O-antigen/teichoic acid export membrane protein